MDVGVGDGGADCGGGFLGLGAVGRAERLLGGGGFGGHLGGCEVVRGCEVGDRPRAVM